MLEIWRADVQEMHDGEWADLLPTLRTRARAGLAFHPV
jgi:hypothetical protein